jgi:hypothetical protein
MNIFVQLSDEQKFVTSLGMTRSIPEEVELTVDDTHEVLRNPFIFRYKKGQLVKDTLYQQQQIKEKQDRKSLPTTEQKLEAMQQALDELILGGML